MVDASSLVCRQGSDVHHIHFTPMGFDGRAWKAVIDQNSFSRDTFWCDSGFVNLELVLQGVSRITAFGGVHTSRVLPVPGLPR